MASPMWWVENGRKTAFEGDQPSWANGCGCPLMLPHVNITGSILTQALEKSSGHLPADLAMLFLSNLASILLPFVPWLFVRLGFRQDNSCVQTLKQIGCSADELKRAAAVTGIMVMMVVIIDASGISWPQSWNTDHTCTYHMMFCEPTQHARLVRHPGNAFSNVSFLFAGLVVLQAQFCHGSPLWVPDTAFGVALVALASASFLWHASSSPVAHYPDLAVMETVISYLEVRSFCAIFRHRRWLGELSESLACSLLFTGIAAYQIQVNVSRWLSHSFHQAFPTGRSRLAGKGGLPIEEISFFFAGYRLARASV